MTRLTQRRPSPLRDLRRSRTLNQEQLAALVGVSQERISRAECGRVDLPTHIQARIAAIFGVSIHEVFPASEDVTA